MKHLLPVALLLLLALPFIVTQDLTESNFACENCVFELDGVTPRHVRAMYLENLDVTWNPAARSKIMQLRGQYISDCDDPVKAVPECFDADNWNGGWLGETFATIKDKLGLRVTALTRANFSVESSTVYQGASSYTRCCWEVKLGKVDMCVGDFWEMPDRRRITAFTSALDLDQMKMVTLSGGSKGFQASQFLDVFQPFKPEVWGILVGFMVATSMLLYAVESNQGGEDFEYEDNIEQTPIRWVQGFCKAFYFALLSYVSAAPVNTPMSWPGRLLQVSLAFLLFVFVASYTANLAFFLIAEPSEVYLVDNSSQLTGPNGKPVCMLEAMMDTVEMTSEHGFDWYGSMLWAMHQNRQCDAAIIGKTEYLTFVQGSAAEFSVCTDPADKKGHSSCQDSSKPSTFVQLRGEGNCPQECQGAEQPADCPEGCKYNRFFCDILTVPENYELSIPIALPVNQTIHSYMSAWIVKLKLEQTIPNSRKANIDEKFPVVCSDELNTDEASLSPESLAGTFLVAACIMVLGLILHAIQYFMYKGVAPKESDLVIDANKDHSHNGSHHHNGSHQSIRHDLNIAHATEQKIVKKLSERLDGFLADLDRIQTEISSSKENQGVPDMAPYAASDNGSRTLAKPDSPMSRVSFRDANRASLNGDQGSSQRNGFDSLMDIFSGNPQTNGR